MRICSIAIKLAWALGYPRMEAIKLKDAIVSGLNYNGEGINLA
jgi:hypothetical protein